MMSSTTPEKCAPADRYAFHDEYILQEMTLLFRSANAQERIRLLAGWNEPTKGLPFEIAKLAIEDQNESVRYWMARNAGELDYRRFVSYTDGDRVRRERDKTHPERDLEALLRADPVAIVRAATYENYRARGLFLSKHQLAAISHLERLGFARYPQVPISVVCEFAEDATIPTRERQEFKLPGVLRIGLREIRQIHDDPAVHYMG